MDRSLVVLEREYLDEVVNVASRRGYDAADAKVKFDLWNGLEQRCSNLD